MALRFHNTLTQQIEEFQPADGHTVRMYTCGPTVWNFVHIGNLRTFTFQDILRRWLRARGFALDHVMNLTDVDDRIIREAAAAGKTIYEYTEQYTQAFLDDAAALRLERPERLVKATDHIPEMVEAIRKLSAKGFTYESEGSVYFRVSGFKDYGKLSHSDFGGMKAGARVDTDKYDKTDARDFALWKARKEGEHFWEAAIGAGRPGWHIECSVMSMKYLGETLDIHAGGVDLTFPHHENEIAQSEALTGKRFARFWLHSEHLMLGEQVMSKSLGNFYTLRDLLGMGYTPEAIRYLLASVPYRKQLNFTFDGLHAAATAIERLRNFDLRLAGGKFPDGAHDGLAARAAGALRKFEESLDDDLNTAEALGAVFEYVRDANTAMDAGEFRAANTAQARGLLARFDAVFDVLKPAAKAGDITGPEIEDLIAARTAARKARDFKRADEIRMELADRGVILEDTRDGVRWKRK
ncbi:MAG: cysteine--tRNA ligase [Acidobacteria bacterium]|nr:cysteine--tRNA ligase [Acidobacteriota bacterium]